MAETWFRGESTIVGPAKPGTNLHDFGEGIYFVNRADIAKQYAELRVSEGGGEPRVLSLNIERSQLGNVLNLNTDPRWLKFLRSPMTPNGPSPEQIIRTAGNENYGKLFSGFILENKINLRNYNAVEGPELVRGGTQLCILHVDSQQSALAQKLKQLLVVQPSTRSTLRPDLQVPSVRLPAQSPFIPNSPIRRVLGNQAAVALFGQLVVSAMQGIGEYGINQQIKRDIDNRLAPEIAAMQARGSGVLVIAAIQEALYADFNGVKGRLYLTSYVRSGISPMDALSKWQHELKYLQGPSPGFGIVEQYVWIESYKR